MRILYIYQTCLCNMLSLIIILCDFNGAIEMVCVVTSERKVLE